MTTDWQTASFVHLRAHSEYSLRDGILRIKPTLKAVKKQQMPALAFTDFVNLFGLVKFYQAALKSGVKPIIGADLILHDGEQFSQFTALCMNKKGYLHLTELISRAYVEGQVNDEPTIRWEWLQEKAEGLIILSGARFGNVGQLLLAGNNAEAIDWVKKWQALFPERFYLELQRTGRDGEEDYIHAVMPIAAQCNLPVVATNDVRFLAREDFEAHEARVCIHDGYVLGDNSRPRRYSEQQFLRSPEQMQELFSDIPEALQNTVEIAKRCSATLELGKPCLPNFPIPEGDTVENFLAEQSRQGLKERLAHLTTITPEQQKAYDERLNIELNVINNMGFPGYFLIVADFIQWAKEHGIPVGPGRGSGAGSLVAYVLKITELDPLEHELLFERFLNPERVSMPDFDIDFCMERRDQVIDYVAQHYGREAVSQIITYGTMAAKAVVRDVGRVLGMSYGHVDKIAKLIPFEIGMTLEKALEQEEQLQERYDNEEAVTTLIDLARKLEGVARNAGKHAGGVVIAPTKLTDFAPLYCEPGGGNLVTQFDKDDVESVGLVKFDFLGLRTLTIIDWALETINKKRQQQNEALIDIDKIPLDDEKTFKLLQKCATTAVFQLESRGMKELIRRLQPDSFEDITALVALFRPGPLQSGMVDDFIDRKHGRASVNYPHPSLETVLKPTYGVILYQEQVMQIAQVLSGYSLGGADILRRAMGKKKPEEMAKQRKVFTDGAVENNVDADVAEHIFDLVEKFAGYGFNKSHSAAYALIAYQTAYLKAHFPAEFMAAVLSSDMDNTDKVVGFVEECQSIGLNVIPPNINEGYYKFTVNEDGQIVYGLGAIKGVGEAAVEHMVAERDNNHHYTDLFSFCQRLNTHMVNRRVLDPLIKSGALDDFNVSRAMMAASVNKALKSAEQKSRNEAAGQTDLFGGMAVVEELAPKVDYVCVEPWRDLDRLQAEKATLGFYVSGHPLDSYEQDIKQTVSTTIAALTSKRGKTAKIAGMLLSLRGIVTRTGRRMGVTTLEDMTGRLEVTLFSQLYDAINRELEMDKVYVVSGKVEDDDYTGGVRMVAETFEPLAIAREKLIRGVVINVSQPQHVDAVLEKLPMVIEPYKDGFCPIYISYQREDAKARLQLANAWSVTPAAELIEQLEESFGTKAITLEY